MYNDLKNEQIKSFIYKITYCRPIHSTAPVSLSQDGCWPSWIDSKKHIMSHKTTSKLAFKLNLKPYRQVCCKEPLSFGWKITSIVSFGFAPFNLHCYGKPLDLDWAQNHWSHHNRVWQLPFSHLFGSKIKIPGKVNPGSINMSYRFGNSCLEWIFNKVWNTYWYELHLHSIQGEQLDSLCMHIQHETFWFEKV